MLTTTEPHHFITDHQSPRKVPAAAQNIRFPSRSETSAAAQKLECAKLAEGCCSAAAQNLCCEADGYGGQ